MSESQNERKTTSQTTSGNRCRSHLGGKPNTKIGMKADSSSRYTRVPKTETRPVMVLVSSLTKSD